MADPANNTEVVAYQGGAIGIQNLRRANQAAMDASIERINDEFLDAGRLLDELRMIDTLEILGTGSVPTVTFSVDNPTPEVSDVRDAVHYMLTSIKHFEGEGKSLLFILERERLGIDEMVSKIAAGNGRQLEMGMDSFHIKLREVRHVMKHAQADIDGILAMCAKRERGCREWLELLELKRKMDEGKTAGAEADR